MHDSVRVLLDESYFEESISTSQCKRTPRQLQKEKMASYQPLTPGQRWWWFERRPYVFFFVAADDNMKMNGLAFRAASKVLCKRERKWKWSPTNRLLSANGSTPVRVFADEIICRAHFARLGRGSLPWWMALKTACFSPSRDPAYTNTYYPIQEIHLS